MSACSRISSAPSAISFLVVKKRACPSVVVSLYICFIVILHYGGGSKLLFGRSDCQGTLVTYLILDTHPNPSYTAVNIKMDTTMAKRKTDEELLGFLRDVFGSDFDPEYGNYHLGFRAEPQVEQVGAHALIGGGSTDQFYSVPIHLDRLRLAIQRFS